MTLKEFKEQRDELREVYREMRRKINMEFIAMRQGDDVEPEHARKIRTAAAKLLRELVKEQDDALLDEFYETRPILRAHGRLPGITETSQRAKR